MEFFNLFTIFNRKKALKNEFLVKDKSPLVFIYTKRSLVFINMFLGAKKGLLVKYKELRGYSNVFFSLIGDVFGKWYVFFQVVGYSYTLKARLKRRFLRVHLGYSRHKIILTLPFGFFILGRRRKFFIFSLTYSMLKITVNFLYTLRDILPYKLKGFISFGLRGIKLKQGKKVKYR